MTQQDNTFETEILNDNSVASTSYANVQPLILNAVPCTDDFWGDHEFSVEFAPQAGEATKATVWTASAGLNKLFARLDKACPIRFTTSSPPPTGSVIRVLLKYSDDQFSGQVVNRCPNHSQPGDATNIQESKAPATHVIRCGQGAVYETCLKTGIHSVVVPYRPPEVGTGYSEYLFSFVCLTSCVGGIDRRGTHLVFTLENNNVVIGRRAIKLKVCACPGRDKKAEEKKLLKRPLSRQSSGTASSSSDSGLLKKQRKEKSYTITLKCKEHYDVILPVVKALEKGQLISSQASSSKKVKRPLKKSPATDDESDN